MPLTPAERAESARRLGLASATQVARGYVDGDLVILPSQRVAHVTRRPDSEPEVVVSRGGFAVTLPLCRLSMRDRAAVEGGV